MKRHRSTEHFPRRHLWGVVLAAASTLLATSTARADGPDPAKLFTEGTALIEQGRCPEALPMLQESQRLDPGIGTLFNIAVCQQTLGQLGTAWRSFETVAQLAGVSGKKLREESARAKLVDLRPIVPALVIQTEDESDVTVKLDGALILRDGLRFVPVDPGEHTIDVTAPGKVSWSSTVRAPAGGATRAVVVPKLLVPAPRDVVNVGTTSSQRTVGFVLAGIGVAGLATAAVTGIMLLDASSTADDRCTPRCVDSAGKFDSEGADAVRRGQLLLPINAVAWAVGGLALGAGAVLLLTARPASSSRPALAPAPRVDVTMVPAGGSLRVVF